MLNSRFLQLVMWIDCNSHCVFCLNRRNLSNPEFTENKKENIKKAIELVNNVKENQYDFIGLIGGEFFQGQITEDIIDDFKELVRCIKDKIDSKLIKQVFIATSMMGPNNYEEFMKYFSQFDKSKILVCTSYNEQGQFGEINKVNWHNSYNKFTSNGYKLHIEIIASEANLNAILDHKLDLTPWVLDRIRIDFLRPIHFVDGKKEDFSWFFPKRETFIRFLTFLEINFPLMLNDFMSLKQRASELHNFSYDMTVTRKEEFDEGEGVLMSCGHSEMFQAYIDSDKCMACDILAFNKRNKYRTIDRDIDE